MSESDRTRIKKIGSFTILSGLGATLVAGALAWLFNTTLENKITFAPVVFAIQELTDNLEKQEARNSTEHILIIEKLQTINTRININETKLFRVVEDCKENNDDIKMCQRLHK